MLHGKKVVCVLPAFNAQKTLETTLRGVPPAVVDLFILVDDASSDTTVLQARKLAKEFPLLIVEHEQNKGYGGNQKTCYLRALAAGADIVVMLHPDYQYEPRLLGCLAGMTATGVYDVAIGSRILGKGALLGGMPKYKYVFNRLLTAAENILIGQKLSEYHTGYRAFSQECLQSVPFLLNDDDFVFDNQMLVQCHLAGFRIGEISVPTKYFPEASSISFGRSVKYGWGVLFTALQAFFVRSRLWSSPQYPTGLARESVSPSVAEKSPEKERA